MGMFWPPDRPAHVVRLVGLVGIVAACCAIADRNTRYRLLRGLYGQLRRLDPEAAAEIEARSCDAPSTADKAVEGSTHGHEFSNAPPNARDTRSYASDSTAFSRAASPQPQEQHVPTPGPPAAEPPGRADADANADAESRPSSALCNTPEAVSLLGDALRRLQLQGAAAQSSAALYTPSPLSRTVAAADVVLLPLVAGGPAAEPAPKVIDMRGRLTPLPNPKAPAVKPTTDRDGRPQPFDYTPPAIAAKPVPHRERGHVELETTDRESYGFVSNPSALVPLTPGAGDAQAQSDTAAAGDHYLFVCVKCHRQSTNDVCEKICSDEDGVLRCRLRPGNGQLMEDLEDLVMPMTPKMYMDGRRKTTGRMLFENLQALHAQHERAKDRAACRGAAPHSHDDRAAPRGCPNAVKSRLRIVPVNCLSMCHLGNVIAMSGPGKFGYQFGAMHENDSEDMQAILQFAEDYIESPEGFTKNKTRPPQLSRNILARIPPPLPSFTSIAE
ncbi:hypothetical protein H4R19_004806 [Coemansia spiralis]|nr:hypothetical protein H4R19_004806 [Coemansia spiralis]